MLFFQLNLVMKRIFLCLLFRYIFQGTFCNKRKIATFKIQVFWMTPPRIKWPTLYIYIYDTYINIIWNRKKHLLIHVLYRRPIAYNKRKRNTQWPMIYLCTIHIIFMISWNGTSLRFWYAMPLSRWAADWPFQYNVLYEQFRTYLLRFSIYSTSVIFILRINIILLIAYLFCKRKIYIMFILHKTSGSVQRTLTWEICILWSKQEDRWQILMVFHWFWERFGVFLFLVFIDWSFFVFSNNFFMTLM